MAAPVSVADVRHVALLARLGLTDERAQALTRESTRFSSTWKRSAASTRTASPSTLRLTLVCDSSGTSGPPIAMTQGVAGFAPEARDGLLLVPRLATHEDAAE